MEIFFNGSLHSTPCSPVKTFFLTRVHPTVCYTCCMNPIFRLVPGFAQLSHIMSVWIFIRSRHSRALWCISSRTLVKHLKSIERMFHMFLIKTEVNMGTQCSFIVLWLILYVNYIVIFFAKIINVCDKMSIL